MKEVIAGIDIGGTKIALAIATPDRRIIAKTKFPTEIARGPEWILQDCAERAAKLAAEAGAEVSGFGVGCAGPVDIANGRVLSPPNLPGWNNFPIVEALAKYSGVPVVLENDANVAALGEQAFGAGRAFNNIIYVTISTGIGGSIISSGNIIHGLTGNAGEIGHMTVMPGGPVCGCGARGCLEAICSGTNIAKRFLQELHNGRESSLKLVSGTPITTVDVARAAAAGDPLAKEVWDETIYYLAIGIGNLIVMFEPEAIIIGGGVSLTGDLLFAGLRTAVKEHVKIFPIDKIQILPAELGGESGLYGTLALF